MKLTKAQREQLKNKFGGHCAYCGCELSDKWHADHIEPVDRVMVDCEKRGIKTTNQMHKPHLDTIENLNPACVPCNSNKSSIPLEKWRDAIAHYRDVQLLRDSTHARHLHRFGLIEIKNDPVMFFFETYNQSIPEAILEAQALRGGDQKAEQSETAPIPKWSTIKVVCQRCGHYLNGCHCNHFGDQCPHLNTSKFGENGLAECFNCNKIINKDREVVGGADDINLPR